MSRDIVDTSPSVSRWAGSRFGVEGEAAELGAVGAEDADVAAGDEEDDSPAFEGGADADVVEAASVAEGDGAALVDLVAADAVAEGLDAGAGRVGFLAGGEGFGGGAAADGAVGSVLVVGGGEAIELGLELLLGGGWLLLGEEALEGLVEAFDLSAGLGVVGAGVLGADAECEELGLHGCESAAGRRGEDGAVVGEERRGITPGGGGAVQGADHIGGSGRDEGPGRNAEP